MLKVNGVDFSDKDTAVLWNLIRNEFEHVREEIQELKSGLEEMREKRERDLIEDRNRLRSFKARINAGFILGLISLLGVAFTAIFVMIKLR